MKNEMNLLLTLPNFDIAHMFINFTLFLGGRGGGATKAEIRVALSFKCCGWGK